MTDPKKPDQSIDDAWADAMFEQENAEQHEAERQGDDEDPWAAAMAEQAASASGDDGPDEEPEPARAKAAGESVFRPLEQGGGSAAARDLEMIMDIPVKLAVELGRTRITIKQLLELAQGSVIELDGLAGEPMDILINGYLIAQGEVVVVDDKYGIRITEIITPSERVQKLNR
ncbi:flagellar motor switch protein FliN [Halomonas sp. LBP4]|uniref:flagellar motor switch protein FliN n=1 Tax=Halomonas sp. LBP4 TaxID=2044917 RepID=UPI000D76FCF2|nr:flagellar motor switch protein FliN [Halomonas sp. LBP4]PXX96456.1 flagellar motor switch protein FliN [Halomonas sp. LBP4]